jgi:GTP cyclohydrolase II
MLKRVGGSTGAAAADAFVIPRVAMVAAHHMLVAIAGRVGVTVMLSQEKPGRHVTVVTIGRRTPEPLVRVHSSCLYGETLGSLECDCAGQLREALRRMKDAGSGILVYLDQEGRGAGLSVKALAHELAERLDFDAHGAYTHLGIEHDTRSYADAVRVLKLLGVSSCVLLTNNPAKIHALETAGIAVRPEALWVGRAGTPADD